MAPWETSNSAYGKGVVARQDVSDSDDDGDFLGLEAKTNSNCGSRQEALKAVRQSGDALLNFGSFKDDREVVLTAVQTHVDALLWADAALREDRAVVLAAVKAFGRALRYTSTLRDDPRSSGYRAS